MARPPRRVCTPHDYQCAQETRQPGPHGLWPMSSMWIVPGRSEHRETCSTAEATRGHHASIHAVLRGLRLADPGIIAEQSRLSDIFTDVCVASSNAAAARGDAPQAAFDRKTSHHSREITARLAQGIVYHPLVWTADGRPHPAVTRTPQFAPDIAMDSKCEQKHSRADGNTKIKQPSSDEEQP